MEMATVSQYKAWRMAWHPGKLRGHEGTDRWALVTAQ